MDPRTIVTIPILPFGMLNAFLIKSNNGIILVDTGLPDSADKILQTLQNNGFTWHDIKLIMLTHGHIDHAGSASQIRKYSGAPILAHESEIDYLNGTPPKLRTTGTFGNLFRKTGAIERPFPHVKPDIVIKDSHIELSEYGYEGTLIHTPGHTSGSISLLLNDGNVFAGDLAASGIFLGGIIFKNTPKRPPFEENPKHVAQSLSNLIQQGGKKFHLGHGGPLNDLKIKAHIQKLERIKEF